MEQPSIVQALPAEQPRIVRVLPREQLHIIQALPATPRKQKERIAGATASSNFPSPTGTSRCTRLQAAPDWSTYDTLVLLNEIASMDEDWLKALSSYQKWKMIADNCAASNVVRSSHQCKRRWKSLLSAHSKIREWEFKHGEGSYWSLDSEKKKHLLGLPYMLDQEVFSAMDAVIRPQEGQAVLVDMEVEGIIMAANGLQELPVAAETEMLDVTDAPESQLSGSKENIEDENQDKENLEKARIMMSKLHENAQQIHVILKHELEDNLGVNPALVDLAYPSDAMRLQADQLIKALRSLVGPLNQFTELIKAVGYEGIQPI
ncbi:uncharacterized protein LOC122029557 isoform X1 [Zingiber officinale]|uniref:uncharacterized protein LOC122029557 isoform X1 n=1 Tax=Zingiber officinale TaxID=94328 RepID=UPI001C4B9182|nr:uncharacterized protein LOC122029557 isoform X1 [Zingiber officinale]XP_042444530.1 uncharacterized protein LOC122029557 isoform X1 [Zingiber officinale]XP_042444531.1 uncharacterized protein LOC122029557 isoform X1 [Zingiber officinale]